MIGYLQTGVVSRRVLIPTQPVRWFILLPAQRTTLKTGFCRGTGHSRGIRLKEARRSFAQDISCLLQWISMKQKRNKSFESTNEGFIRTYPCIHETKEKGKLRQLIKLLKRLKKGHWIPVPLLEHLRLILEHTHNRYTFEYRCNGLQIIIEKQPDNSIVAYYADDRDGRISIDTTQPPFDKILIFS